MSLVLSMTSDNFFCNTCIEKRKKKKKIYIYTSFRNFDIIPHLPKNLVNSTKLKYLYGDRQTVKSLEFALRV